jgi:hypothetical protein
MNRLLSHIHFPRNKKKVMLFTFVFAGLVLAIFAILILTHLNPSSNSSPSGNSKEQKNISEISQSAEPVVEKLIKTESDTTKVEAPKENSSAAIKATTKTETKKQSSTPPSAPPQQTAPQVNEFGVNYLIISGSSVYCSYYGDGYDVHINDVSMGLRTNTGGNITIGFEVSGGIKDTWNGYRQPVTVPAGTFTTSLNKAIGKDPNYPQYAYSQTVPAGHGPAAVRAVVYTPNVAYSQWIQVPAQQNGEKCN